MWGERLRISTPLAAPLKQYTFLFCTDAVQRHRQSLRLDWTATSSVRMFSPKR